MVNISYKAYCCLPHWGLSKWPNEGENTVVDSTDQSPLVHWPQEGTRQYLKMMKTTFSDQWTKTEEGWYLKTSAKPADSECLKQGTACSRLWFKDAKKNSMPHHHKCLSTRWERKRWLSLFIHNWMRCVIRSQQTPTLKASKTQPWEIFLPDLMPTQITTSHNKSDAVSHKLQSSVLTLPQQKLYCIWLFHGKAVA